MKTKIILSVVLGMYHAEAAEPFKNESLQVRPLPTELVECNQPKWNHNVEEATELLVKVLLDFLGTDEKGQRKNINLLTEEESSELGKKMNKALKKGHYTPTIYDLAPESALDKVLSPEEFNEFGRRKTIFFFKAIDEDAGKIVEQYNSFLWGH